MSQTRTDGSPAGRPLVERLRGVFGRQLRREFANRHLGSVRKSRLIVRDLADYRRRRALAKGIDDSECLPELTALKRDRVTNARLDPSLLSRLLAACDERIAHTSREQMAVQEGKEFYLDLLIDDDYDPSSPFMQFALDPTLLATASSYFGIAAYLQSIELIRSQPMPARTELFRSQLWHCDNNNDTKMLKLFVYITDVGPNNGPLTFLPYSYGRRLPWYRGHYISDETAGRHVPMGEKVEITGPRGTTSIMDTAAVFHCGSRCVEPRITFVIHYNTGFGFLPRTKKHAPWLSTQADLSPMQRMALGSAVD